MGELPNIPEKDRIATLTAVWAKNGDLVISHPNDMHIALPMLAAALDGVVDLKAKLGKDDILLKAVATMLRHCADIERMAFMMEQKTKKQAPRIVPATILPSAGFDPRFLKKY